MYGQWGMSWFVEIEYKSANGLKRETYTHSNKGMVFKHYRQWERNPEKFSSIKLFEQHVRQGVPIKARLHMSQQGYMFDDEIPF